MSNTKPIIGITMGDPAGIGMEIILKTFSSDFIFEYCTPVLYGTTSSFKTSQASCALEKPRYYLIDKIEDAKEGRVNLMNSNPNAPEIELGKASQEAGLEALKAIDRALDDAKTGKLHAMVTAPVDKNSINASQSFTGHTGYIAKSFGVKDYLMILFSEDLRVGLVTEHLPVKEVANAITTETIVSKGSVLIKSLQNDFGIIKPKIAVLGLNPHAGDGGALGQEEKTIILPAIEKLKSMHNAIVFGPYPGDSIWGQVYKFDAVLAMYHDQGLAPFKALSFNSGVNFTAGLPIVRTSPDHGTAYDIAGKNMASFESFSTALFEAIKLISFRNELVELKQNFLTFTEQKRERFRLETRDLNFN